MFKRIRTWLRDFFLPPAGAPLFVRLLPYITLGVLTLIVLVSSAYAWDYTNSPGFCGTACHTMPPEFNAYLISPHARIDCVECHIGRDFIATRITRKAGDVKHIIATAFKTYEFPIRAKELRPARETCERCHSPEKFSDDSLREIQRFEPDINNTPQSIYLSMKTGGGSEREGLGRGIHWHIEKPILYYPSDAKEQEIPYIRLQRGDEVIEYLDIESDFDPATLQEEDLEEMDCITCHNRITHLIYTPEDTVDQLLARELISSDVPEIRLKAVQVYHNDYGSLELAMNGIAGLKDYYRVVHPEFYAESEILVDEAIAALQQAYRDSVFPEQKADWTSHPNNIGHKDAPGCFRCHDGKHLNTDQEAIRLECNLCHSIPVVAGPSDFIAQIEISRGPEPESHLNPNWIALHHEAFNPSCSNCHSTDNPGGVDDSSFCSNSACHGNVWEYAGFDAPALRATLLNQLEALAEEATPMPEIEDQALTFEDLIGPLFEARCGDCHAADGLQDLNLTDYQAVLAGGLSGPAVIPGNPDGSLLVQKQTGEQAHFGQLNPEELALVIAWIEAGAPERQ
jgi:nitrate/TMAO reductase-like tetraheme cytochrome c subunit